MCRLGQSGRVWESCSHRNLLSVERCQTDGLHCSVCSAEQEGGRERERERERVCVCMREIIRAIVMEEKKRVVRKREGGRGR